METLTKGWQVLLGSLLGDGGLHILGNCKNASFKEYYSMKQVEYLKWKHKTVPFKTKFLQSTKTTEEKNMKELAGNYVTKPGDIENLKQEIKKALKGPKRIKYQKKAV